MMGEPLVITVMDFMLGLGFWTGVILLCVVIIAGAMRP